MKFAMALIGSLPQTQRPDHGQSPVSRRWGFFFRGPFFRGPDPQGRAPSGGRGAVAPSSRDRASDARLPLRDTKVFDWLRLSATWRLGLFSHGLLDLLNL